MNLNEPTFLMWLVFFTVVFALLIFDLGGLHRKKEEVNTKKNIFLSFLYIFIGFLFSLWIFWIKGSSHAGDYLTGYLIEKSLSLDNIFVIFLIFNTFQIPPCHQHRVLFWGILGVLILRGIMIAIGSWLIHHFEWVTYVFALFLMITGIKMLIMPEVTKNIQETGFFRFLSSHLKITPHLYGEKFIVWIKNEKGQSVLWVTPLFLVLTLIESADLIFAVDSVPAILSITTDPYIVYTSNIFAILGLRSLYFVLSEMVEKFYYLKHALSLILIFIGGKVLVAWGFSLEKIPSSISLSITLALLLGGIIPSFLKKR